MTKEQSLRTKSLDNKKVTKEKKGSHQQEDAVFMYQQIPRTTIKDFCVCQ